MDHKSAPVARRGRSSIKAERAPRATSGGKFARDGIRAPVYRPRHNIGNATIMLIYRLREFTSGPIPYTTHNSTGTRIVYRDIIAAPYSHEELRRGISWTARGRRKRLDLDSGDRDLHTPRCSYLCRKDDCQM